MVTIVLASRSPRRKELLERLGFKPMVVEPPDWVEETSVLDPRFTAMLCASRKAEYVYREVSGRVNGDLVVVGADTIIVLDDRVIGKPRSVGEARRILSMLSGRWHRVYTGLSIIARLRGRVQRVVDVGEAWVKFKELSWEEIEWYISTGEPLDAAGAYKVQGLGGVFVEEVRGDYYSIVGLPLSKLYRYLSWLGVLKPTAMKKPVET